MSTAQEIAMKMESARKYFDKMVVISSELSSMHMFRMYGREVCSRRAREIRKRGDHVRFFKFTITGKARYLWLPGITIKA